MPTRDKKKILIAEDDMFIMDMYQMKFSQEGYEVFGAKDGEEALQALEKEKFDLILLDIVMPNVNGFDFLRKIKAEKKFKDIPVILLSNLSQKKDIEEGLELGADDYLIKYHFSPTEVLEKVRALLNQRENN